MRGLSRSAAASAGTRTCGTDSRHTRCAGDAGCPGAGRGREYSDEDVVDIVGHRQGVNRFSDIGRVVADPFGWFHLIEPSKSSLELFDLARPKLRMKDQKRKGLKQLIPSFAHLVAHKIVDALHFFV